MKKAILLFLIISLAAGARAQKKKSRDKTPVNYETSDSIPPPVPDSKKGKGKGKKAPVKTEYVTVGEETPVADTATRFTGIIKYRMTSDDPADKDSMIVYFGETQIRVTMFIPGYRADQIFEQTTIARFSDSTLITLDPRTKTYKTEHLLARNEGTAFNLANDKKTMSVLGVVCPEYSGEMILKDGDSFEAAALVSKQHSFIHAMYYNFLNIQPMVYGYRIVLGWRTKSSDNENSYIMAYKIERGNVESAFDLSAYKPK